MIIRILSLAAILAWPVAASATVDGQATAESRAQRREASLQRAKQRQAAKDAEIRASKAHQDHVAAVEKEAKDVAEAVAKRKQK